MKVGRFMSGKAVATTGANPQGPRARTTSEVKTPSPLSQATSAHFKLLRYHDHASDVQAEFSDTMISAQAWYVLGSDELGAASAQCSYGS